MNKKQNRRRKKGSLKTSADNGMMLVRASRQALATIDSKPKVFYSWSSELLAMTMTPKLYMFCHGFSQFTRSMQKLTSQLSEALRLQTPSLQRRTDNHKSHVHERDNSFHVQYKSRMAALQMDARAAVPLQLGRAGNIQNGKNGWPVRSRFVGFMLSRRFLCRALWIASRRM